jgi:hypothetical protein
MRSSRLLSPRAWSSRLTENHWPALVVSGVDKPVRDRQDLDSLQFSLRRWSAAAGGNRVNPPCVIGRRIGFPYESRFIHQDRFS